MVLYCNPLPSLPMFTVWIAQLLMDFLLCTGRSQGATLPSKWASEQRAFPSMPGQGKLGECVEKIRSWHVIFFENFNWSRKTPGQRQKLGPLQKVFQSWGIILFFERIHLDRIESLAIWFRHWFVQKWWPAKWHRAAPSLTAFFGSTISCFQAVRFI